MGGEGDAEGVEDGEEVDHFLEDGGGGGGEDSGGSEAHADDAEGHAADGALQGDAAHAFADVQKFIDFDHGALHDHGIGGFGGNVAAGAEGDADGGDAHGGGVIDAIADEDGLVDPVLGFDDGDLLLRALGEVELLNADLSGHVADLGLAVTGEEHEALDAVAGAEVVEEAVAVFAGCVVELEHGSEGAIEHDDALEPGAGGGEALLLFGGEAVAAGDEDLAGADHAANAGAGGFADAGDRDEGESAALSGFDHGLGERVAGVALEGGGGLHDLFLSKAGAADHVCEGGLAVGEGAGLIEDEGLAGADVLENGGIADEDAAAGGEGDGAEHGDGDADQERARGGDGEYGEEAVGFAGDGPRGGGDGDGEGGVPRAETVAEAAEFGALVLGIFHDLDDAGEARILGQAGGADGDGGFAVHGAGDDFGAGGFADGVRLAGEVRLVHDSVAFEHIAIGGDGFVGEDDQVVADGDLGDGDVLKTAFALLVGDVGEAFGEGGEGAGGASGGPGFEGSAAGEHEHDDGADQVLGGEDGGNDGHAGEQVRAEIEGDHFAGELPEQGETAGEGGEEGQVSLGGGELPEQAEQQMNGDAEEGPRGDPHIGVDFGERVRTHGGRYGKALRLTRRHKVLAIIVPVRIGRRAKGWMEGRLEWPKDLGGFTHRHAKSSVIWREAVGPVVLQQRFTLAIHHVPRGHRRSVRSIARSSPIWNCLHRFGGKSARVESGDGGNFRLDAG